MIITSAILIALCASPFFLIGFGTRKKEKTLKKELQGFIKGNNGFLSEYNIINDFIIALDDKRKTIYFHNKLDNNDTFQVVELAGVGNCEIEKLFKPAKKSQPANNELQSLSLNFISQSGKTIDKIELFNYDNSSQINGEIDLARNWKDKISSIITHEMMTNTNHI